MVHNPDKTLYDYKNELPGNLWRTIVATLGMVGTAGVLNLPANIVSGYNRETQMANEAEVYRGKLQGLIDAVKGSKVHKRSPEVMRELLRNKLGADNEVVIETRAANAFFQDKPEVLAALPPETRESVMESLKNETDVFIPIEDYATDLADHHAELEPNLRNDIDGMTMEEQEQLEAGHEETLEQFEEGVIEEADRNLEFQESAEEVYKAVKRQLDQTKRFTKETNEKLARLHETFSKVMAERAGTMPSEVYSKFGLQIGATPVATAGFAYNQNLDDIMMPEFDAEVDGEIKGIKMTAQQAMNEVTPKIEALQRLQACING
jgi:hypothetical protein